MRRKVYLVCMVKNEADIIESFVRYHAMIFDGMVFLDNNSTDRTNEILQLLKAEGYPLDVHMDTSLEYSQVEKTNKLLNDTFRKYNPDFVFPLDVDEFLVARNRKHPREIIEDLDLNKVYYLERENYVPHKTNDQGETFIPAKLVHSVGIIERAKVFVSKEIMQFGPKLTMGNHNLIFDSKRNNTFKRTEANELLIAHYPIRSLEHAKSKFLVGWLNNLARPNHTQGQANHWKVLFRRLKNRHEVTLDDIVGNVKTKVNPINLTFCKQIRMKYTKENEINAMKNLLEYCEMLATEYAKLKSREM